MATFVYSTRVKAYWSLGDFSKAIEYYTQDLVIANDDVFYLFLQEQGV
jgi:hypothetical protein